MGQVRSNAGHIGRRVPPASIDYARVEALIERLIDLLDQRTERLADMEPDHDGEEETDECPAGDDRGTAFQLADFRRGSAAA
jgi:hypothetical protein